MAGADARTMSAELVPVPDAEFGFRPVAFIRTAGSAVEPELLSRELERTLPRFKIPVAFHGWLEETGGMKPDRASLRERARRLRRGETDYA